MSVKLLIKVVSVMEEKNSENNKTRKHKDYISFKPKVVKFLEADESKILYERYEIIGALRNKYMTAKEIHNLFFEKEANKHRFTIKTIYRHLEKMEKTGLVAVAGHRMTEGSRIAEKLYARTASIFFQKQDDDYKWWEKEKGKMISEKLNILVTEYFSKQPAESKAVFELFKAVAGEENRIVMDLLDKAKDSEKLSDLYSKTSLDKINYINLYAAIFILLLEKPEIFKQLEDTFIKTLTTS